VSTYKDVGIFKICKILREEEEEEKRRLKITALS